MKRTTLTEAGDRRIVDEAVSASVETLAFDPAYAVRMISDIVLNPFVGREIVPNRPACGARLRRREARDWRG
jgi:type III restriction enzyme